MTNAQTCPLLTGCPQQCLTRAETHSITAKFPRCLLFHLARRLQAPTLKGARTSLYSCWAGRGARARCWAALGTGVLMDLCCIYYILWTTSTSWYQSLLGSYVHCMAGHGRLPRSHLLCTSLPAFCVASCTIHIPRDSGPGIGWAGGAVAGRPQAATSRSVLGSNAFFQKYASGDLNVRQRAHFSEQLRHLRTAVPRQWPAEGGGE